MNQDLHRLIIAERELMDRMVALLEREQSALEQNQADTLAAITADKQQLVGSLEQAGRQRLAAMDAMLSTQPANAGIDTLLALQPQLAEAWQALMQAAERCREMNQANGAVVEAVARQTAQALEVLQGKHANEGDSRNLYDQTGQLTGGSNTHSLTQV